MAPPLLCGLCQEAARSLRKPLPPRPAAAARAALPGGGPAARTAPRGTGTPSAPRREAAATGRAGEAPSRYPRPGAPGGCHLPAGRDGQKRPEGGTPLGKRREESDQLTRAVAPAHGAGEQEGACEETGSGAGRVRAMLRGRPAAPSRAPRYPPRRRGASHMAAGRARTPGSRQQRRGERRGAACPAGRVGPPHPTAGRPQRLRGAVRPAAAAAPALNLSRGAWALGGREGGSGRRAGPGWAVPSLGEVRQVPRFRPRRHRGPAPRRAQAGPSVNGAPKAPRALVLSSSPPPRHPPPPGPQGLIRSGRAAGSQGPSPFPTCPHAALTPVRLQLLNAVFQVSLLLLSLKTSFQISLFRTSQEVRMN